MGQTKPPSPAIGISTNIIGRDETEESASETIRVDPSILS